MMSKTFSYLSGFSLLFFLLFFLTFPFFGESLEEKKSLEEKTLNFTEKVRGILDYLGSITSLDIGIDLDDARYFSDNFWIHPSLPCLCVI